MNPSWLSIETFAGLTGAAAFAVLCAVNMRAGILAFTALGAITGVSIGAFSGRQEVQGLLPVEVLATVMVAVWLVRRRPRLWRPSFETPLFLLLPVSLLSLAAGRVWLDPTVPATHVNLAVSIGQIMLFVWPIGTYLVVADTVRDTSIVAALRRVIVALAIPALALPFVPDAIESRLLWSTAFALPAASICLAESFDTRSLTRRIFLLVMTVTPAAYGFVSGKAFFYGYVVVSSAVILAFRAPRALFAAAPVALALYVLIWPIGNRTFVPGIAEAALRTEREQQSLGGPGGREQLIVDGLGIWSRYPVLGVGPGNNYPYMLRYSTLGTPHNQYVNLLVELGVVGFTCFAVFAIRAGRLGLRLWRDVADRRHRQIVLAWLGVFSGMLAGGMFGDFVFPSVRNSGLELFAAYYVQWVLLGALVGVAAMERQRAAAGASWPP